MMILILSTVLLWCFYLPLFYMTGSIFSKPIQDESPLISGVLKTTFGMGIIGYLVIFLGSIGQLKAAPIYISLIALFLCRFRYLKEFTIWIREIFRLIWFQSNTPFVVMCRITFLVSLLIWIVVSFTPEIANDSLAYHLYLPKVWIEKANILPLLYDEKSYRSLFMEVLFCVPMLLKNIPGAIIFHGITGLLLIVALVQYWYERTNRYGLSLFLAILLWLTPTVYNQIANSYTDASVALFAFASFYLFEKALHRQQKLHYLFSGLFMGFAVSCKLLALLVGFGIGCWGIVRWIEQKEKRSRIVQGLLLFCVGTLLTCGYWYIRNYLLEGDFLYPLFTNKFGTVGLYEEQKFSAIGVPKTLISFVLLPILTAFCPDPFNRHHWVGPFYLLLFPFTVIALFKSKSSRGPLIVSFISATCWFFLAQDIRFLFPAFPMGLTGAAFGLSYMADRPRHLIKMSHIKIVSALALILYLALGIYHYRVQMLSALQRWDQQSYLSKLERSYPMATWMNNNLPDNAKVLNAIEVRTFYFDPEMIDLYMFLRIHPEFTQLPPDAYIQKLKSMGISHVLHTRPNKLSLDEQARSPKFVNLLKVLSDHRLVTQLKTLTSENIREEQYIYTLYQIR